MSVSLHDNVIYEDGSAEKLERRNIGRVSACVCGTEVYFTVSQKWFHQRESGGHGDIPH